MARTPVYYTFGNHMHWVDMQWLWGYGVLPGSVRDMLRLIRETGARGNVNFDAVGYEKMAAECPDALEELRRAVGEGLVEPVGCSYGQPYGLFHGGESNIRQLTYGVRATRRLLGARPRAFWEEEFYFFPQLPQMLAQCGYTGACLFFQWTWHTPELPKEMTSLIRWEGADGSQLPALPRNELNVHQWPEDFDGLLEKVADGSWRGPGAADDGVPPAVVQWLELMPSRDWMCRSEVLLPRLKELMGDQRFEVRPRTVSGVIGELDAAAAPVRRYSMDDVWHGMTLGKHLDAHPRASREAERRALAAEAISALAGLLGRPYASWDVYPAWETDEAWRELLAAQHHDNHECESLCGFIGHGQFRRSMELSSEVITRTVRRIAGRINEAEYETDLLHWNFLGWPVTVAPDDGEQAGVVVPPFGFACESAIGEEADAVRVVREAGILRLERGALSVDIDASAGVVRQIRGAGCSQGTLDPARPLLEWRRMDRAADWPPDAARVTIRESGGVIHITRERTAIAARGTSGVLKESLRLSLSAVREALDVEVELEGLLPAPPGYGGALVMRLAAVGESLRVRADTPMGSAELSPSGRFRRKYPEGDWMTSRQWFEEVVRPFTALSWLMLSGEPGGAGLAVVPDGQQQLFHRGDHVLLVLRSIDPWDGDGAQAARSPVFRWSFAPRSAGASAAELARFAAETHAPRAHPPHVRAGSIGEPDVPPVFGPLCVEGAPGVLAHAFFRESMKSGEHMPAWAGHRMFEASGGACDHPFVIRLVEWNGEPAEVELKLAGPVAMAAKTNLMGEVLAERYDRAAHARQSGFGPADTGWLEVRHPIEPPAWALQDGRAIELRGRPVTWSGVRFRMRPHEIATVYADLEMGRKQWRDLDAKREVWATIHREPG